jgi:precorrin-6B methylase 2
MLKLDMTYTETLSDNDQKEVGSGTGAITIEISKVDQVTVTSPVQ